MMEQKLKGDQQFLEVNPRTVGKVILLTGTNNVDSIYYGSRNVCVSKNYISNLLIFLKTRFSSSSISIVNILPRAVLGRNHIIIDINTHIKKLCEDQKMVYIDTESEHGLFSTPCGARRANLFRERREGILDNVHLNRYGVVRLARHMKYIAHSI